MTEEIKKELLRIATGICKYADDTVWITDGTTDGFPETAVDALTSLAQRLGATEKEVLSVVP